MSSATLPAATRSSQPGPSLGSWSASVATRTCTYSPWSAMCAPSWPRSSSPRVIGRRPIRLTMAAKVVESGRPATSIHRSWRCPIFALSASSTSSSRSRRSASNRRTVTVPVPADAASSSPGGSSSVESVVAPPGARACIRRVSPAPARLVSSLMAASVRPACRAPPFTGSATRCSEAAGRGAARPRRAGPCHEPATRTSAPFGATSSSPRPPSRPGVATGPFPSRPPVAATRQRRR